MGSEGESIPLEDTEIDQSTSSVVLRRHKASTCTTRRNVAIIDGTLVSSGSNIQAETEQFDLYAEDDSIRTGRIVQDDSTEILQTCKRTILKPYFTVLKLIGWRRFSLRNNSIYMRKFLNIFLPLLILTLWMIGFSAQLVLCFDRRVVLGNEVRFNGTKFLYYRCDGKYFLRAFIPVLLVVASYIYGVYIFRYVQIEHLSSLTEKVYLGYTDKDGPFSQKRLLASFRILVLVGILWLMWSFPLNILRVVSLKFTSEDTYFYFLTSYNVNDLKELYRQNNTIPHPVSLQYRYILIVLSVLGFTLNDLFYIAAVLNYALQCQLIYFLVNVTVERISNSCWKVDHAIKEIKVTQDFLKVLNGGLATQMSLVLFIVLQAFVLATLNFLKTCDYSEFNWSIEQITGILNITSWLFLIAFITISAMRLTNACQRIHKLGIELRTRPFMYSKISKLDLDSFLLYTSKITLNARLVEIPMKPIFVIPVLFTIAVIWGLLTFY